MTPMSFSFFYNGELSEAVVSAQSATLFGRRIDGDGGDDWFGEFSERRVVVSDDEVSNADLAQELLFGIGDEDVG